MSIALDNEFVPPPLELTTASVIAVGGFPSLKMYKVHWNALCKVIPELEERGRPLSVDAVAELNLHLFRDYRFGAAITHDAALSKALFTKERHFGRAGMDKLYVAGRHKKQAVSMKDLVIPGFKLLPDIADLVFYSMFWAFGPKGVEDAAEAMTDEHRARPVIAWILERVKAANRASYERTDHRAGDNLDPKALTDEFDTLKEEVREILAEVDIATFADRFDRIGNAMTRMATLATLGAKAGITDIVEEVESAMRDLADKIDRLEQDGYVDMGGQRLLLTCPEMSREATEAYLADVTAANGGADAALAAAEAQRVIDQQYAEAKGAERARLSASLAEHGARAMQAVEELMRLIAVLQSKAPNDDVVAEDETGEAAEAQPSPSDTVGPAVAAAPPDPVVDAPAAEEEAKPVGPPAAVAVAPSAAPVPAAPVAAQPLVPSPPAPPSVAAPAAAPSVPAAVTAPVAPVAAASVPQAAADPEPDHRAVRTLDHVKLLLGRGYPGLALALARAYEDNHGVALPGAPTAFALLAAAVVQGKIVQSGTQQLDLQLSDALSVITGADEGPAGRAIALAAVVAALRPALFDLEAGVAMTVLREVHDSHLVGPAMRALADTVARRDRRGIFEIRPEALFAGYQMSSTTVRELQEQYARQAKDIIEEKSSRFIRNLSSLPPAKTQYQRYLGADHAFGKALRALLNTADPEAAVPPIRAALKVLDQDRDNMIQADFKAADGPTKLIGAHYERVVSFLEELEGFFESAARDLTRQQSGGGSAQLAEFSAELDRRLAAAMEEIDEATIDDEGVLRPLVRECVRSCLEALRDLVATGKTPTQIAPLDEALNSELSLLDIDLGSDVDGGARSRYSVGRETAFAVPAEDVMLAIQAFDPPQAASAQDYLAAAERHLNARRLLSARRAVSGAAILLADKGDLDRFGVALDKAVGEGRGELAQEVANLHTQVDSAAALSLIDDETKSQFDAILDRVGRRGSMLPYTGPIEDPAASDDPTDLQPAIRYLRANIQAVLQRRIDRGCEELLLEIERDHQTLPPEAAADVERVRQLVKSQALANAKEFWSLVKSGQPLPEKTSGNEMLREFNNVLLPLFTDPSRKGAVVSETLAALATGSKRPWLPELDGERAAAAEGMLDTWQKLMAKRPTPSVQAVGRELVQFLQDHVGWTDITAVPTAPGELAFRVDGANLAQLAGSDVFTLPCLGSERNTSYAVTLLPAQTPVPNIRMAMDKADIVFFRGALTAEQRADLHQHVRREHRGALVVDDLLITYMAIGRRRIERMLAVGSSFIHSAPYRNAQDMPREMFFGRRRVQQQILNAKEGVLVYGGRRLGKSAVINEICARETRPKQKRYYVKIDVYNVVASEYAETVWSKMARVLVEHGVLPRTTNTSWPKERLAKEIADAIVSRQLDVTVFIDEADTMMRHDAQQEPRFPLLVQLNQLRKDTGGRFKFAVAGLNNAERVIRYANALMDQFQLPIALTPFVDDERRAGLDLVVKPLGALGFEFQTPDMPYEILSRCIFFPALIQIWCERLLHVLYEAPHQGLPPYTITRAHMNAVDRDSELSRSMLKIFQSTLELDPRYRVLAFALAYEQMQSSGTNAVSMTPANLAAKACEYAPQILPPGSTNLVGALGDELVNLGIFIRTNAGREFQLRSISLLARLGTKEEIETALVEAEKAQMERDEGERRVEYRNERMCPVPLRAIAEWGCPAPGSPPVRIVAASPATGWDDLTLLGHDTGWIGGRAEVCVQRWVAGQTKQVAEAVVKPVEKVGQVTMGGQVHSSRGITVIPNGWPGTLPGVLQQRAADITNASRVVIMQADAAQVRTLAELNELPCPLVSTGLWGVDALHWYAERKDMAWALAGDKAKKMLDVTGGSPTLLVASMDVIAAGGEVSDWRAALAAAKVGTSAAEVLTFFGVASEHHALLQGLVTTTFNEAVFATACEGLQKVANPAVLLTCLVALGAVVPQGPSAYVTNPVIDEAVLAE